jgi:transposase
MRKAITIDLKAITIDLTETDRLALSAIVTDRNNPQKHVWRAQIVLLTAEGCGTMELTRRTGTSETSVWRWQERFLAEGLPGLLRDKTRPSRIPPLGTEIEARVVAATQTAAPGETTHWTSGAMAKHIGISVSSVQRIWRKHGLQPHKIRQFKRSNDPRFAASAMHFRHPGCVLHSMS